jgi:hypothetical protein
MSILQHKRKLLVLAVVFIVAVFAMAIGANWVYAAACTGIPPFPDVPASNFACTDIQRILNLNITTGIGGNYLGDQNVTRYQMAAFLNRVTTANSNGTESYLFNLDHNGNVSPDGAAIRAFSEDGNALYGISDGAGLADNGVEGLTNSTSTVEAGVLGQNNGAGPGLLGVSGGTGSGNYGVRASSSGSHGVYATTNDSADYAGYFTGGGGGVRAVTSNDIGVSVSTTGGADAINATSADNDGIYGNASDTTGSWWGLWGQSNPSYGLYANTNTAASYAGYFADDIFVSAGCVGCNLATVVQNGDKEALEPGDLVVAVGVAPATSPEAEAPAIMVSKATAATAGQVVGVVKGHFISEIVSKDVEEVTTEWVEFVDEESGEVDKIPVDAVNVVQVEAEDARMEVEAAPSGEYAVMVYGGVAQVKVDASLGAIAAGDSLALSADGRAVNAAAVEGEAATGRVLGVALEAASGGESLIWVLISPR